MRVWSFVFVALLCGISPAFADFSACDAAYRARDIDQKIVLYTTCINEGGLGREDRAGAYNNRGIAFEQLGKIDEALADFTSAIEMDPTWGTSYLNRAQIYVARRQWDLAKADLTASVGMQPANIRKDAYDLLLRVDLQLHDSAGMSADLKKLTGYEPNNVLYQRSRAWLLATCDDASVRDGPEAVKAALKAVAIEDDYQNEDVLAAAYAEAGQFDEAIASETKAIDMAKRASQATSVLEARLALFQQHMPYHETPEPVMEH